MNFMHEVYGNKTANCGYSNLAASENSSKFKDSNLNQSEP